MRSFVFPGQASQKVGMGDWLIERFPTAREIYERADDELEMKLTDIILNGPMERLTETEITQPAVLTTSVAFDRALREMGYAPDVVAGHSLGEYSALVSAGALDFGEALRAVRDRGRYMQEAMPLGAGTMAAIFRLDPAVIEELCSAVQQDTDGVVEVAGYNAPDLTVISGDKACVLEAMARCKAQRGNATEIAVSAPFHCARMRPAADALAERLAGVTLGPLAVPYVANVDGEQHTDHGGIVDRLVTQVVEPVRWLQSSRTMVEMGVDEFLEVGPGNVLCGFTRRLDRGLTALPVSEPRGRHLFDGGPA